MPSDTNYAPHIPDAVRRASARADELAREAGSINVPDSGDASVDGGSSPQFTTEVNAPDTAPVAPDSATQTGDGPRSEQPAPSPAPAPTQVDWEQRYSTLQGKYNSEIPELRGQIRSLENLIATMNTAPRSDPMPVQATHVMPSREIPSADVEAWGQDLVDASQRWAEARIAPRLEEFERRLLAAEGGARQLETRTAQQSAEAALERVVPNWREINSDPQFHLWLDQRDMFSGHKRQALLTEAHHAGDAARVIAIFRGFLAEQTAVSQPYSGIPPAQTAPAADRLPLESLAVPGRGQTAPSAQSAPEKKIWTTAEITQFYRSKTRGMWQGREAEMQRLDDDIIAAGREGRVRSS